jgi:DNA repair protein RecN (Recombination protein N)
MLKSLSIRNYALIDNLTIQWEPGLNIITGETGAGKSIIIDALSLALGERAETGMIRKGAEKAFVEAIFDASGTAGLRRKLEEHEIEPGEELILRRELSLKGQSRSFINDSPVTTAILKDVGDSLVDLHGQHEHQSLLRTETHLGLLDEFGGLQGLVDEFRSAYDVARATRDAIASLRDRENALMDKKALYEFQLKEIDEVDPKPGEEQELENELNVLENSEKLFSATERIYQLLYEGEHAVHDQLIIARNELAALGSIDQRFEEPVREAQSAAAIVDELAKFIQYYNSRIEFNPERLELLRDRLGAIALLKKKYGGSLEAVIALREKIRGEVALAENFQGEINALQERFAAERKAASEIAKRLSAKRHESARTVGRNVAACLAELGIPNAVVETSITTRPAPRPDEAIVKFGKETLDASPSGVDNVEFLVSMNTGEDAKPLVKVASGGEISRIMLSFKMILARTDRLPLLVFDEIDVGISGRIAQAVGLSLKKLSRFHQVISITHLPQIAGLADAHFVVEKGESDSRTATSMRKLDLEERVTEVAKLLSGADVTESGKESARELMGVAAGSNGNGRSKAAAPPKKKSR